MSRQTLVGKHILIARPSEQSQQLVHTIQEAGGQAIVLPTMHIEPVLEHPSHEYIAKLPQAHIAIFVSVNAAKLALPLLKSHSPQWPAMPQVAAMGPTTAQALVASGISVDLVPTEQFNSEALLALPAFQNIDYQQIVIFKGMGGREYLAQTLIARGAQVHEIVTYRRDKLALSSADFRQLYQPNNLDMVIATSGEALSNLWALAGSAGQLHLKNTVLLVSSDRIKQQAKALGFKHFLLAEDATEAKLAKSIAF